MPQTPEKICVACGRPFAWRKRWRRNWTEVRYCSDACRRDAGGLRGATLEAAILDLLSRRGRSATICPSEAARLVAGDRDWRPLLEPTRRAARRLAREGRVEVLQRGRVIDAGRAKGPIRLRQGGGQG